MTASLFASSAPVPLAERLRPAALDQVVGQEHLLNQNGPIGRMVASKRLASMILWGPAGVGKTTIARLLAASVGLRFEPIHAVSAGVADLRKVIDTARAHRDSGQAGTLLFVDEIHAFKKNQQDTLLEATENGTVVLVGCTTENPSFELNRAILSRADVYVLKALDAKALERLAQRAEVYMKRSLPLTPEARAALIAMAGSDGRRFLNLCEEVFAFKVERPLDVNGLHDAFAASANAHAKADDEYELLSALQKSIRGSDVQAALYWAARMVQAGIRSRDIFRRLVVMASEEIGLCDPNAVTHTVACAEAMDRIGDPKDNKDAGLPLAQAVAYLATAPKSNAVYLAWGEALGLAESTAALLPPKHILNAPTALMKREGYGAGYIYDHDAPHACSGQEFFPDALAGERRPDLYRPNERGNEREVIKRMAFWEKIRVERRS